MTAAMLGLPPCAIFYTLKLSAWEVRNLMQHYKLIGREWEDVMGTRNDALEVFPTGRHRSLW